MIFRYIEKLDRAIWIFVIPNERSPVLVEKSHRGGVVYFIGVVSRCYQGATWMLEVACLSSGRPWRSPPPRFGALTSGVGFNVCCLASCANSSSFRRCSASFIRSSASFKRRSASNSCIRLRCSASNSAWVRSKSACLSRSASRWCASCLCNSRSSGLLPLPANHASAGAQIPR